MRWTWGLLFVLGLLVGLSGCRRRGPAYDARVLQRYERNMVRLAARDSRCHPQQVQPVRIGESLWVANTCSGPREYSLQCRPGRRRWRGCRWRRVPTVTDSAAAVLQCPAHTIQQQVTNDPSVRVALGCGRQVAMRLQCHPGGCGWIGAAPGGLAPAAPPGYGAGGSVGVSGGGASGVIYVPAQ